MSTHFLDCKSAAKLFLLWSCSNELKILNVNSKGISFSLCHDSQNILKVDTWVGADIVILEHTQCESHSHFIYLETFIIVPNPFPFISKACQVGLYRERYCQINSFNAFTPRNVWHIANKQLQLRWKKINSYIRQSVSQKDSFSENEELLEVLKV